MTFGCGNSQQVGGLLAFIDLGVCPIILDECYCRFLGGTGS